MKQRKINRISLFLGTILLSITLTACGTTPPIESFEADSIVSLEPSTEEIVSIVAENEEYSSSEYIHSDVELSTVEDNILPKDSTMEVHFLNVGQGDSTLIKCDGYNMLIDTSENTQGTAIQLYLQKQNVEDLSALILTHPDADHIGSAPTIITKFNIDSVYMSDYTKDNKTYDNLLQALSYRNLKWSTPAVGDSFFLGSAKVTFIAPNTTYGDPNNASIGLLVDHGNNTFLFTGDAEDEAEQDIVANGIRIQADVYQVGHHGSRSSSSEDFLNAVNPSYAVISCGENNSYGHPHAQTLNAFRSRNIQIFRTDEQGTVVATSDGTNIIWNCAPSDTWQSGEPMQNSQNAVKPSPVVENTTENNISDSSKIVAEEEATLTDDNTGSTQEVQADTVEVHITKTGKKYHRAGCSSLSKSDIPVSLNEAKEKGLEPCKNCNPPTE